MTYTERLVLSAQRTARRAFAKADRLRHSDPDRSETWYKYGQAMMRLSRRYG